jgi:RimJ/RimL family protein N-acetyltransferase
MAGSRLQRIGRASAIEFIRWQPATPDPGFLAIAIDDPGAVMLADDAASPAVLLLTGCWTGVGFIWGDVCHYSQILANIGQVDAARRSKSCCLSVPDEWAWVLAGAEARFSKLPRVSYTFDRKTEKVQQSADFSVERLEAVACAEIRRDLDPGFPGDCGLPIHGAAIRRQDRYVSCAWGPQADGVVEIAVVTHPEFQRRGLAKTAATQLIDELLGAGLTPHVSTNEDNEPARRWAESVGFAQPIHHQWAVLARKRQD